MGDFTRQTSHRHIFIFSYHFYLLTKFLDTCCLSFRQRRHHHYHHHYHATRQVHHLDGSTPTSTTTSMHNYASTTTKLTRVACLPPSRPVPPPPKRQRRPSTLRTMDDEWRLETETRLEPQVCFTFFFSFFSFYGHLHRLQWPPPPVRMKRPKRR